MANPMVLIPLTAIDLEEVKSRSRNLKVGLGCHGAVIPATAGLLVL